MHVLCWQGWQRALQTSQPGRSRRSRRTRRRTRRSPTSAKRGRRISILEEGEAREYYHDRLGHERWLPPGESARELLMEAIDVEAHHFLIDSDVEHWGSDDEDDDDWDGESDERNEEPHENRKQAVLDAVRRVGATKIAASVGFGAVGATKTYPSAARKQTGTQLPRTNAKYFTGLACFVYGLAAMTTPARVTPQTTDSRTKGALMFFVRYSKEDGSEMEQIVIA